MASRSDKLEELRQAVLGDRGREVEVDPTGEIRVSDQADDQPSKPSKMSPHTFGG